MVGQQRQKHRKERFPSHHNAAPPGYRRKASEASVAFQDAFDAFVKLAKFTPEEMKQFPDYSPDVQARIDRRLAKLGAELKDRAVEMGSYAPPPHPEHSVELSRSFEREGTLIEGVHAISVFNINDPKIRVASDGAFQIAWNFGFFPPAVFRDHAPDQGALKIPFLPQKLRRAVQTIHANEDKATMRISFSDDHRGDSRTGATGEAGSDPKMGW